MTAPPAPGDEDSALLAQVRTAFAPHGWLAKAEPHFRPRPGQTAMAEAVAETIHSAGVLVVEAGTGVGKPFLTWCQRCSAASGCWCRRPPRRCKTSCTCVICRVWCRLWDCRCVWRV